MQTVKEEAKGVVNPHLAREKFRLARYLPEGRCAECLDHFWIVEWNLQEQPAFTQKTLPYPCVNLVFDRGRTAVFGVVSGAYDYTLSGSGKVLGLRFKPGGFYGLLKAPLSSITDKSLSLQASLGCDDAMAERRVFADASDQQMVAAASALLLPLLPPTDPQVEQIQQWLMLLQQDTSITRVEVFAERTGYKLRTLQQLFSDYIGVSPKWVLRRYRLHEVASQLASGNKLDLTQLALELGYFDQAHLSKDFKHLIGCSPAAYRSQEQARKT